MTQYVVFVPGNEDAWEASSDEQKSLMYAKHREFAELLAARGHKVVNGAELTPSRTAHVVRGSYDDVQVTEGPYAEAVEQITGFYLIESADLDDLLQCVGKLAEGEGAVEVRACVGGS